MLKSEGVSTFETPPTISLRRNCLILKRIVMAGLFLMFIVTVMFAEMLDGYLKAQ